MLAMHETLPEIMPIHKISLYFSSKRSKEGIHTIATT